MIRAMRDHAVRQLTVVLVVGKEVRFGASQRVIEQRVAYVRVPEVELCTTAVMLGNAYLVWHKCVTEIAKG